MLNRILLRKIKSPLSLRGAKRRSNLSGFSLIELMIAVVILAMAIFGIFHAYSVGFMGMADARDRTVATNYLRETIEDFKNMNFNKVKDEPITLIPGTKFHRGSIVLDLEKQDEVVTLKKIITQVRWMDRNGNVKTEEASTIIYKKPATSEDGEEATSLVLYAESYYTILPEHDVKLIAEIKDENGNIYDWDGEITFSVITVRDEDGKPLQVGDIATEPPVYAIDGIANCIFTAIAGENIEGIERIQATATVDGNDLSDTVNIRVTTGPVGIILEPATEGDRILPAGDTSTINLIVVKADYSTPIEYNSTITLTIDPPGLGTLDHTTFSSVPTDGISFNLTNNGTPGIVEIIASAPDLDMGYTEVIFTGEPFSILVEAGQNSIYPGEETTITVTIVDENNEPVSFGESGNSKIVTLSASPNYGIFDDDSNPINLTFEGESSKTCFFKASSIGEFPQEITINANDSGGELNSGSTKINILSPLVAHHIEVSFDSPVDLDVECSLVSSKINAIMKSEEGDIVYGKSINFEVIKTNDEYNGYFEGTSPYFATVTGGIADIDLYPIDSCNSSLVEIHIYSGDLDFDTNGPIGNPGKPVIINVLFHKKSEANSIKLSTTPENIFRGGETCTITATIVDIDEVCVYDYFGVVSFSITSGEFYGELIGDTEVLVENGIATVILQSTNTPGTVKVMAEDNSLPISSSDIDITVKEITLDLVDGSEEWWESGFVIFDIEIDGPILNLTSMKVEWNYNPSKLKKIEIKSPSIATEPYDPIIDTGNASSPYTKNDINANLLPGKSTIRLSFSKDMTDVPIEVEVIFYTDFEEFPVYLSNT